VRTSGGSQISPLRYPGFPVDIGGVVELHAAFLSESRARSYPVQRGRKSGYAPVEMTILFEAQISDFSWKCDSALKSGVAEWRDLWSALEATVHSSRSNIMGSTDNARCAGIQVASSPSSAMASTTPANTIGSRGVA
jgi:hypothetical protein